MKQKQATANLGLWKNIHVFIQETDIRALVFLPAIVGGGGSIILALIFTRLLDFQQRSILLSLGFLITSLGGVAEVVKREMPGAFGGVVKGPFAVISGIVIIILFGGVGIIGLIFALLGVGL